MRYRWPKLATRYFNSNSSSRNWQSPFSTSIQCLLNDYNRSPVSKISYKTSKDKFSFFVCMLHCYSDELHFVIDNVILYGRHVLVICLSVSSVEKIYGLTVEWRIKNCSAKLLRTLPFILSAFVLWSTNNDLFAHNNSYPVNADVFPVGRKLKTQQKPTNKSFWWDCDFTHDQR